MPGADSYGSGYRASPQRGGLAAQPPSGGKPSERALRRGADLRRGAELGKRGEVRCGGAPGDGLDEGGRRRHHVRCRRVVREGVAKLAALLVVRALGRSGGRAAAVARVTGAPTVVADGAGPDAGDTGAATLVAA